jgi:hypothetical protein
MRREAWIFTLYFQIDKRPIAISSSFRACRTTYYVRGRTLHALHVVHKWSTHVFYHVISRVMQASVSSERLREARMHSSITPVCEVGIEFAAHPLRHASVD